MWLTHNFPLYESTCLDEYTYAQCGNLAFCGNINFIINSISVG